MDGSRVRSRLAVAAGSVVPATGLAVLVNVWTTGWAWPAGVGVAVLVAAQVFVTFWTTAPSGHDKTTVRQRFGKVERTDVTGARLGRGVDRPIDVDQSAHTVSDSTFTGVEIGMEPDSGK